MYYIVVFLKDTKDPLQGISKLNFGIIIPTNEKNTSKFKEWFINGDEFNLLDQEQRNKIIKYINLNVSEFTNVDSSLD